MGVSEAIKQRHQWHIVELGGLLLGVCRTEAAQIRSHAKLPDRERIFVEARRAANRFFKAIDDEELDRDETVALAELAASYEPNLGQGMTARALALGLDNGIGERFGGFFRGKAFDLEQNAPCPVALPPLKDIYGELCTNPDRASEPIDRTPRMCLCPADTAGLRLRLNFAHEDHFSRIRHGATLAAALPNAGLEDLKFDRFSRDGIPLFYGVRPQDSASQSQRVARLLDRAAEKGVDVIVLPELCADEGVFAEVRGWRAGRPTGAIPVIVAGSRHTILQGDNPGENEALVLFSTGDEATHRKIAPYVLRDRVLDDGSPSTHEIERKEFIRSQANALTVHYSGDWSMTIAICKDILETPLVRALEDLRIRLVLVPSCSDKTDLIEQHAVQLSRHAQAAVVVANVPSKPDAARAVFSIPAKHKGLFVSRSVDKPGAPVICVFETKSTPGIIFLEI